MLTHRNLLWNLADTKEVLPFVVQFGPLCVEPLAHSLQRFVFTVPLLKISKGISHHLSKN